MKSWQLDEDYRCPVCGFYRDTPNHELGCPKGRAAKEGNVEDHKAINSLLEAVETLLDAKDRAVLSFDDERWTAVRDAADQG